MKKSIKFLIIPLMTLAMSSCSFPDFFNRAEQIVIVESVSISETSKTINIGEDFRLTAELNPSNSTEKTIFWSSSNNRIATVDENGRVVGVARGSATITARSKSNRGATATCEVRVEDPTYIHANAVSLSETNVTIMQYETATLTATISPNNANNQNVTWSTSNSSIATVEDGVVTAINIGECTVTATSVDMPTISKSCTVTIIENTRPLEAQFATYNYNDYSKYNCYNLSSAPNTGNCKLLVVPVWFNDSDNYILESKREVVRNDIRKAYFGTTEETGWNSVKTFYETESFGKISMDGVVTDWYECGKSSTEFYSEGSGGRATSNLVASAVDWYKETYNVSAMTDFDQDHNGWIDGVMLIYAAPEYQSMRDGNAGNMWAYCYWLQEGSPSIASPLPNAFFWASYDFMYSQGSFALAKTGKSGLGYGDTSRCNVDSHTFIHEMGHVFGLSDYYDYTAGYSPAAGFSMQDHNVGAHDPYSRFALGWAKAYVPTRTQTFTVGAMELSGECVLLSSSFTGSPFDEYIMLELFSKEGVNKTDATYGYSSRGSINASYGVRVWHVDSRLFSFIGYRVTTNPTVDNVTHATSNSAYVNESSTGRAINYAGSYDYNQLHLIRNNESASYHNRSYLNQAAMFYAGDTFSLEKYSSQFVNGNKLNNGLSLGWEVTFNSVTASSMNITCTKL